MNQILGKQFIIENTYIRNSKKYKNISLFFLILFFFFIFLFVSFKYNSYKKEIFSKELTNNYEILTLYSSSTRQFINLDESFSDNNSVNKPTSNFVIGLIKIDKIDLSYPILSSTSDELLEIAPCRFFGPMPNEAGNLCIAGHNNSNNTIFGKLFLVDIGDLIDIYDLNGEKITYIVYDKYEVNPDDLTCLDQSTNEEKEITLITCNSIKGTRNIIKAKENR